MKLTESVLRQIIKQELEAVLAEAEEGESIYDRAQKAKSTSPHAAELKARIEASQKKRGKGKQARSPLYTLADEEAGVPAPKKS
jgi:hypothetical protein